jgi:hypothetical protein
VSQGIAYIVLLHLRVLGKLCQSQKKSVLSLWRSDETDWVASPEYDNWWLTSFALVR